jgi:hypothetical protein
MLRGSARLSSTYQLIGHCWLLYEHWYKNLWKLAVFDSSLSTFFGSLKNKIISKSNQINQLRALSNQHASTMPSPFDIFTKL